MVLGFLGSSWMGSTSEHHPDAAAALATPSPTKRSRSRARETLNPKLHLSHMFEDLSPQRCKPEIQNPKHSTKVLACPKGRHNCSGPPYPDWEPSLANCFFKRQARPREKLHQFSFSCTSQRLECSSFFG